jgi:hypothetical protein
MDADSILCGADNNRLDSTRPSGEEEKELVVVKWRDIIATSGWEKEPKIPTFYTVGWLVRENKDEIVIAGTLDPDDFTEESSENPPVPYGFHSFPAGVVLSVQRIAQGSYLRLS